MVVGTEFGRIRALRSDAGGGGGDAAAGGVRPGQYALVGAACVYVCALFVLSARMACALLASSVELSSCVFLAGG